MSVLPIKDWTSGNTFKPRLLVQVEAPPAEVLGVLAGAFGRHHYRVRDESAGGFKATYIDWFGFAAGLITITDISTDRTVVTVRATPDGSGVHLQIDARGKTEGRKPRTRARDALNAAFAELAGRGVQVVVSPWQKQTD